MSTTVDLGSATAYVKLDLSGLTAQVQQAKSQLSQLRQEMQTTGNQTGSLQQNVRRLALEISSLQAFQRIAQDVFAFGKQCFDASVKMESLRAGLIAVSGSAKEADRQLQSLREVAKVPGLGFEEAVQGSIRLQAAGLSAQQAEESLRGFGNALATVGKGNTQLEFVTLALSQMVAKGRVMGDDLRQIAEQVPQIRRLMQDAFGTADQQILRQAGITAKEYIETINKALQALPQAGDTVKNRMKNMQDSFTRAMAAIGDSIKPVVSMLMNDLTPAIDAVAKHAANVAKEAYKNEVLNAAVLGRSTNVLPARDQLDIVSGAVKDVMAKRKDVRWDLAADPEIAPPDAVLWQNLVKRESALQRQVNAESQSEMQNRLTQSYGGSNIIIDATARAKAAKEAEQAIDRMTEAQSLDELEKLRRSAQDAIRKCAPILQADLLDKLKLAHDKRSRALIRKGKKANQFDYDPFGLEEWRDRAKQTPIDEAPRTQQEMTRRFDEAKRRIVENQASLPKRVAAVQDQLGMYTGAVQSGLASGMNAATARIDSLTDEQVVQGVQDGAIPVEAALTYFEAKQQQAGKLTDAYKQYQGTLDGLSAYQKREQNAARERMSAANTDLGYDREPGTMGPFQEGQEPVQPFYGPGDEQKHPQKVPKDDWKRWADGMAQSLSRARISLESFSAFYKSILDAMLKATSEIIAKIIAKWATMRIGKALGSFGGPVGELIGTVGGAVFGGLFGGKSRAVEVPGYIGPSTGMGGTGVNVAFHGPVSMGSPSDIQTLSQQIALHITRENRVRGTA